MNGIINALDDKDQKQLFADVCMPVRITAKLNTSILYLEGSYNQFLSRGFNN